ncbi:hypothetical protein Poli38472_002887 [Pythium oligandrum]|uniref:Temptin Cys/Cys disulfide domain-containing protein n=1 Tax=Pythium oligandrum TaxID=41045 RepID=A0A8K1C5L8_PYTOL|nr:hypothetical protein Poli38472_002887 [Pythium oligandrum]|eukprot:TMW56962.1 hypothetical protein Poli38472_002887 [Pythium oligandrum]
MRTAALTSSLALLAASGVHGKKEFASNIPNGASFEDVEALGHVNSSSGGKLNVFGDAFKHAGLIWNQELCRGDADGDGQTNGEELGDPCCVWKKGDYTTFVKGISNPADANSKVDQEILYQWVCGYPSGNGSHASEVGEADDETLASPKSTPVPSLASRSLVSPVAIVLFAVIASVYV